MLRGYTPTLYPRKWSWDRAGPFTSSVSGPHPHLIARLVTTGWDPVHFSLSIQHQVSFTSKGVERHWRRKGLLSFLWAIPSGHDPAVDTTSANRTCRSSGAQHLPANDSLTPEGKPPLSAPKHPTPQTPPPSSATRSGSCCRMGALENLSLWRHPTINPPVLYSLRLSLTLSS